MPPNAENNAVDAIIGRGLISGETVASELRRELVERLTELQATTLNQGRMLEAAQAILDDFAPILAEGISATELAGWIAGANTVASKLPAVAVREIAAGQVPPTPPRFTIPGLLDLPTPPIVKFPLIEKAARGLARRGVVTRDTFDAMATDAKARAFTIAGESSLDAIETVRNVLVEDVTEGTSLAGFTARLEEALDGSLIGPAHLENVYRTNVQAAFAQGHEEIASEPVVEELFPYQEYIPIHDSRTRDNHLALGSLGLDGTGVYRRDDPMWDIFTPPWDFQDRCGVNLLSIEAAARKGVREAIEWERTGEPPENPEWRIDAIPFRPENDFVGAGRRIA